MRGDDSRLATMLEEQVPWLERIVEMHGGTIRAENHPEGGAVFHVRIPR